MSWKKSVLHRKKSPDVCSYSNYLHQLLNNINEYPDALYNEEIINIRYDICTEYRNTRLNEKY